MTDRATVLKKYQRQTDTLTAMEDELTRAAADYLVAVSPINGMTDLGMARLKRWIRFYGFETIMEAIEQAAEAEPNNPRYFWRAIPGIAHYACYPFSDYADLLKG